MPRLKTIEWVDETVKIIDQTQLPLNLSYVNISTIEKIYEAIKTLKIRGAPAIGVAAAFGLYLGIKDFPDSGTIENFILQLQKSADYLSSSRPTAINLNWALDRMIASVHSIEDTMTIAHIKQILLEEADLILSEDKKACKTIGEIGFEILKDYNTLLTHCNAGSLATVEYGTALSPVYIGKEKGKVFLVYVDETRPLLQGARITAFELKDADIPVILICDNMAASVMAQGKIDAVIVGADRIAANGDFANKIGTYGLAIAAKAHSIPFFVSAPLSSFDISLKTGKDIPIEEREAEEVIQGFGQQIGPADVQVYNPAFDITPNNYITAIVTEKKVIYPPFDKAISEVTAGGLLI